MDILETRELSKSYTKSTLHKENILALDKVSMSVVEGEIFGLLGPNGAGKSTFVKILLSIAHPSGGSATLLGEAIGTPSVRRQCGYLPENHRYPAFLTGYEALAYFDNFHGGHRDERKVRIEALLQRVGLSAWSNVSLKKYSKGMLQRLGLAQALLHQPRIVFLDEPTDGVDPLGRKEIRDLLLELRSAGTTVFLNSHLLSEVETVCDRVAILDHGKVLKIGSIRDLTAQRFTHEMLLDKDPTDKLVRMVRTLDPGCDVAGRTLRVNAATPKALNKLIDEVRSHGVMILSVGSSRSSLEEVFLSLVAEGNKPPSPDVH